MLSKVIPVTASTARSKKRRAHQNPTRKAKPANTTLPKVAVTEDQPDEPSTSVPELIEALEGSGWQAYAQFSLCLMAVLATVAALYFARAILFPMALAFVLYFLFAPAVRSMTRFHWFPESVSAGIVVACVAAVIVVASFFLAGPISAWVSHAPETLKIAEEKLRFLMEPMDKIDQATDKVSNMANGSKEKPVIKVSIDQPPITSYLLNATMNFLAGLTIVVALLYLMLAMGHRTLNSIVELMPTREDKRGIVTMIRNVEQGISGYLISVTIINAVLGLVIGSVLGLMRFPDPILLGVMAASLNFVPFVGCIIGSGITFLIGIVYLDTPTQALLGAMAYMAINILEGNVITPMILGRSMKLNPPIVFISIVFWGWVWGLGGILIAVPMLGIAKIATDHFEPLKPVARVLTG
jgi:predicted PurR-regulated permease PerM